MSTTILRDCSKNIPHLVADSAETTGLKWAAPAGSSGPAFRVKRTGSAQTFNQNTFTKIQFNAEDYDTDNCFDSTTNYRFTPNKAGYYQLNAHIRVSKTGQSLSQTAVYKNGSYYSYLYIWTNTGSSYALGSSDLIYFNGSSDYVELFIYDSDASGRDIPGDDITNFSGVWIRS